jgi:hypothetical protein
MVARFLDALEDRFHAGRQGLVVVVVVPPAETATATLRAEQDYRTRMLNSITHDLMNPLSPGPSSSKFWSGPNCGWTPLWPHRSLLTRSRPWQHVHSRGAACRADGCSPDDIFACGLATKPGALIPSRKVPRTVVGSF